MSTMLGQGASDGIFAKYAQKTAERGSHRADLHFADFRVLDDATGAAEILVSYREAAGEPTRDQIKKFIANRIGKGIRVFDSSMQTHPGLSHRNERGGVAVVISQAREFRPYADSRGMRCLVANSLFLDTEGATWDVEAQEGEARRLVRSESESLLDILEQRQAEIGGHDRAGVTFRKAFAIQKNAGRATLSMGDVVKFYHAGKVYSGGVIEALEGDKCRISHPKFEEPITCEMSCVLSVDSEAAEGERKKQLERSEYFQRAYGFPPEKTNELTEMKTASTAAQLGDTEAAMKTARNNIRKLKARIQEYGNKRSWSAEKKADQRSLQAERSRLAKLQVQAKTLRSGGTLKVAHDFVEGEQVKLKEDYSIGQKGLANDFDRTSKIEPTEQVIPAGSVGMIERVVNFGSPNETYVVKFSNGAMVNMPSYEASDLLDAVNKTASVYEENVTVAGVQDVRHARVIARNFCENTLGVTPQMGQMEVFAGQLNGNRATMVNAFCDSHGWRKLAITATRVEDVSQRPIGGVRKFVRRASVDPVARG